MAYITNILKKAATDTGLRYKQGHLEEIVNSLSSESVSNLDIDLTLLVFTDIQQRGLYPFRSASVQMLIIKSASKDWTSEEREAQNLATLQQLELELLSNIRKYAIVKKEGFTASFRERVENAFSFGQRGLQIFNENLDGLEINCTIDYNELNENCINK